MPFIQEEDYSGIDHLAHVFANIHQVEVGQGELERLRAIEREANALKEVICPGFPLEGNHDLTTKYVRGDVLSGLFNLL